VAEVGETEITGERSAPAPSGRTAKGETERRELSKARQAYARRVAEAKATIPHLYARETVPLAEGDAEPIDRAISACGRALREQPGLNSSYRDAGIEVHARVNVAFATPGPDGPLTPTLFDADRRPLSELAAERAELAAAARDGSLAAPALAGGTFTVSAPRGAAGIDPIVAGGQAAALSVSEPRPEATVHLALACDARVVLPDEAAAFLDRVAELLARGDAD
jgi:pyruvate dehydrogenase E2 component (dihydrolipoamide acetyltransferase)